MTIHLLTNQPISVRSSLLSLSLAFSSIFLFPWISQFLIMKSTEGRYICQYVCAYPCVICMLPKLSLLSIYVTANLCQPGSWRNWVWSASPLLPPVACNTCWFLHCIHVTTINFNTFMLRLSVDENPLKLQLLLELLEICQLHIRAEWTESLLSQTRCMSKRQPVWWGLRWRGGSVSASGWDRHHGRAEEWQIKVDQT